MFTDAGVKGAAPATKLAGRPGLVKCFFFFLPDYGSIPDEEKRVRSAWRPNVQWEFDRTYAKVHREPGWALSG